MCSENEPRTEATRTVLTLRLVRQNLVALFNSNTPLVELAQLVLELDTPASYEPADRAEFPKDLVG